MNDRTPDVAASPANPWPRYVSFVTTGSALPAVALTWRVLLRRNRRKLVLVGGLWSVLVTVARRDICAHCPYYGEHCSTLFGKITPLMWKRSDEPLTTQGFYWDLALLPAIFLYPLPELWRDSKAVLGAYIAAWGLFLATMYNLACKKCPLEACPVPR